MTSRRCHNYLRGRQRRRYDTRPVSEDSSSKNIYCVWQSRDE